MTLRRTKAALRPITVHPLTVGLNAQKNLAKASLHDAPSEDQWHFSSKLRKLRKTWPRRNLWLRKFRKLGLTVVELCPGAMRQFTCKPGKLKKSWSKRCTRCNVSYFFFCMVSLLQHRLKKPFLLWVLLDKTPVLCSLNKESVDRYWSAS